MYHILISIAANNAFIYLNMVLNKSFMLCLFVLISPLILSLLLYNKIIYV